MEALTKRQIELIQNSWDFVITNTDQAGIVFYSNLFSLAPELKPLFSDNIEEQANKLVSLLTFVISKLENLDSFVEDVKMLGKRHVKYGVKRGDYSMVGSALIETLKLANGEKWNEELMAAWATVYYILSEMMIKASEED